MIGKNFIKRGLVVGLVALAAIGMLAVTGGAANSPVKATGGRVGTAATSTGQGQNGQCDRAAFANASDGVSVLAFSETTLLTISGYKHPCAGPLLFNTVAEVQGGFHYVSEVVATCVSGCSGTSYGHPSAGGWFYSYDASSIAGFGNASYNGAFPNLAVGIYNISFRMLTDGGTAVAAARSLIVQSYSGPTTGGGGIGG